MRSLIQLKRLSATLLLLCVLVPVVALAQQTTTSTVVSLDQLLNEAHGVYDAFKVLGVMAGITAVVNLLVNLTKFGPVNDFIVRKKIKWLRPVLALIAGFLAGLGTALAEGRPTLTAVLYAAGGMLAGGGSIALHELFMMVKGERGT